MISTMIMLLTKISGNEDHINSSVLHKQIFYCLCFRFILETEKLLETILHQRFKEKCCCFFDKPKDEQQPKLLRIFSQDPVHFVTQQ
jgi:hypothetical protein